MMFFHSPLECVDLARGYGFEVNPETNNLVRVPPFPHEVTFDFEESRARHYALASLIVRWLGAFDTCLMWVTEYGIWPSSENLHLYYSLRRAYGDNRAVREAPGHLFLKHEQADLLSFVDLGLQFGWGSFVIRYPQTMSLIVSHDEWAKVAHEEGGPGIAEQAEQFGLRLLSVSAGSAH